MKELLKAHGYLLNSDANVWSRADYTSIAYSDGDEVENRLASVINSSNDISLSSTELRRHRIDWASFYHLTSCRANILRPIQKRLERAQVLEIGAGCGAITRYLGEVGAEVLALEGSLRRAQIARSRTRDLPNITVLCESFNEFNIDHKFDVVTLIGVLEYARMFIPGEDPPALMLRRAKSLLKPGGILVLAIENKLGLKYFAGAPEDHTSQEMYGIESRYTTTGPVTFGYNELRALLTRAGFSTAEFMSALPDYKATASIITEAGFTEAGFDPTPLAQASVIKDRQLRVDMGFSIDRAWRAVIENKLGLPLANSFLVFATDSGTCVTDPSILGYHYSSDRIAPFCKSIAFCRDDTGAVTVHGAPLHPEQHLAQPISGVSCFVQEHEPYTSGRLLSQDFATIVGRHGWTISEVADYFRRYLRILEASGTRVSLNENRIDLSTEFSGSWIDTTPQNILALPSGEYRIIDTEWQIQQPVHLGWLLFRALLCCINAAPIFEQSKDAFVNTRLGFMHAMYKALGNTLPEERIWDFARSEADWQSIIAGSSVREDFWEPHQQIMKLRNVFDKVRHLEHCIEESTQEMHRQRHEISRLENDLSRMSVQLNATSNQLEGLLASSSWRITAPLRACKQLGRKIFSSSAS